MNDAAPRGRGSLVGPEYGKQRGAHDELFAPHGAGLGVRPHWQRLFGAFEQLGARELEARRREARRLFRENGVSYSGASDEAGLRPVELDPIPYLVPAEDWSRLESGLAQRARLLDAILRDLYGPRHLIKGGTVPPQLILRHTSFLLPVDGAFAASDARLAMYAADVARGADGRFRVVSDRTQSPSGPGLALETRIACSRILPNLIRSTHVHRLARFFRMLRDQLVARAPHQKLDPRIVVLGRGQGDPNYFDHAYLAAYLGFPLVEGEDLTVRDGRLWLRTIGGLKLVDTVLRRLADPLCDPLELEPDSRAGIPGLLQVARSGSVSLANPLGAGVLENPALIPFLPRIARQFLGEELQLESLPTWWCGDDGGLTQVLDRLPELVIKRMDRGGRAIWGGSLDAEEVGVWRDRIRSDPELYVGQEAAAGATTPALLGGSFLPRPVVTRCFAAAVSDASGNAVGDAFTVMPGGFTRVVGDDELPGSLGAGLRGVCKDTWILASEEERHLILWPSVRAPAAAADESLPSRAAENLYWVGRYAERGEYLTRLARTCLRKYNESRDYGDPADGGALTILLRALRMLSTGQGADAGGSALAGTQFVENTLLETVRDATLAGSLASTFKALEGAALSVRDRWSTDSWRVIDDISEALEEQRRYDWGGLAALEDTLDRLVSALVAFTGLTVESMTHESGWHFLLVGRRVERATKLLELLRATVLTEADEGVEHQLLEALLLANESLMTHRRRYRASLDARSAFEVIVLDRGNPRSLAHQMLELARHMEELPREAPSRDLDADQRALLAAGTRVRLADATTLARAQGHRREDLVELLDALERDLEAAVAALNHAFFTHVQPTQQLVAVSLDTGQPDSAEFLE